MKAFIVVQDGENRILGAGSTKDSAEKDARNWTESLTGTRTVLAEVEANSIDEIDAYTRFTEING